MDSIEDQEAIIWSLHSLLPDFLTIDDIGPSFAKFLRAKREKLHPIGVENIRKVETASGLKLNVNLGDRLGCDFFYGFFQEAQDFELLMALVKPGSVFVDVGANIGFYALEACLRVGQAGRVIAIEPDSRSNKLLGQNIDQNGLDARVHFIPACAGPRDGEVEFFVAAEASFSGLADNRRSPTISIVKVPMRSLDSLFEEIGCPSIDFIKIDVEGFEIDVLEGAQKTLKEFDPVIMFELSHKNISDHRSDLLADAMSRIASFGYSVFSISSDGAQLFSHNDLSKLLTSNSGSSTENYFLARRDTGSALRIEDIFRTKIQNRQVQGRLFKNEIEVFEDKQRIVFQEVLDFFNPKFIQANAKSIAYRNRLESVSTDLTQTKASREAYKQQLERANADQIKADSNCSALKDQLEILNAELNMARAGLTGVCLSVKKAFKRWNNK